MHDERQRHRDPLAARRPPAEPPRTTPGALRPLLVAAVLCLVAVVAAAGLKTWRDLATAQAREADLHRSIARTEAEIEALEQRLDRLAHDPAALERLAREELKMTYPDEVVVILPREDGDGAAGGGEPAVNPPAPPPPGRR